MESRHYLLPSDTRPRLELECGTHWRYVHIKMDDTPIGSISSASDLLRGAEFFLPDGGVLAVKLIKEVGASELRVTLNGRALNTLGLDRTHADVRAAYHAVVAIGAVNLIFFFLTLLIRPSSTDLRWFDLAFGVAFLFLGWMVREGSAGALTLALGIALIDMALTLITIIRYQYYLAILDLSINVVLLFLMSQGFGSLNKVLDSLRLFGGLLRDAPDTSARPSLRAEEPITLPADLKRVQGLLRQAVTLYAEGRQHERARTMVKEALQTAPELADGWYVLAYLVESPNDRLRALDRVLSIDPFHAGAQEALDQFRRESTTKLASQATAVEITEDGLARAVEASFSDLKDPAWMPDMSEVLRTAKPAEMGWERLISRLLIGLLIVVGGLIVVVLMVMA